MNRLRKKTRAKKSRETVPLTRRGRRRVLTRWVLIRREKLIFRGAGGGDFFERGRRVFEWD